MIALVLVSVVLRELGQGLIERIAGAQVTGDGDRVTRTGVRPREGPATQARVASQVGGTHALDIGRALPIPELPAVEVVPRLGGVCPTQEDVAGRLHQALTLDDTASLVFLEDAILCR